MDHFFDGLTFYSSTLHCKHGLVDCFLDGLHLLFPCLTMHCDGNGAGGDDLDQCPHIVTLCSV